MNELRNSIEFDVPKLSGGRASPASVESVTLYKSSDTEAKMRITIRRILSVPLESFTFMFRFSTLALDELDSRHPYHKYVYTDDDMNSSSLLTFNGAVPSKMKLTGCQAFVSEVRLADGRVLSYKPYDYRDDDDELIEDLINRGAPIMDVPEAPAPTEVPPPPAPEPIVPPAPAKPKKISRTKLSVILTVLFFSIIVEVIAGAYIFRYSDVKHAAETLISEARYNEAYKLVSDHGYKGLLSKICAEASVYYAENNDLMQAYVYAAAAPEKFTDKIINLAAAKVVDPATGEINENAYRVAKMADEDGKFDSIVKSIVNVLTSKEDFANALRVASEMRGENERSKTENDIFRTAIDRFMSKHEFEKLISFAGELDSVTSFGADEKTVADAIVDWAKSSGDSSGLIYFSTKYPDFIDRDTAGVTVKPDDSGIRAALDVVWPLLTTSQKRTYLSRSLSVYKELFRIRNGAISGTDIKDAVSVDTYEYHTIVLHKNGSVSAIPNGKHNMSETFPVTNDVIAIAAGLEHSVMLHADGTVSAVGSNAYGQCNVSGWTDIVQIAAGQSFTLGLKVDGTVVAVGSDLSGQCGVSGYRNVCAIACGSQSSVMLFKDGTVRIQGYKSLAALGARRR